MNYPRTTTLYSLGRTNSFRAASSALLESSWSGFDGFGSNLQNVSSNLRSIYIPDEGKEFTQLDQDGAEARIVAYLAKPGLYRDLFLYGIKVHSYVALGLFQEQLAKEAPKLDIKGAASLSKPSILKQHPDFIAIMKLLKTTDDWPASKRYYFLGKLTSHSSNYGVKAPTFQLNVLDKSDGQIALTNYESNYFLSFYRTTFPEIPAWNNDIRNIVERTRTLYNLFGHPRYFGGELTNHFFMEANAFIPQSTVGEITHLAIKDTQLYIESNNKDEWDVLQNNHDSLLIQHPPKDRDEVYEVIQRNLNRKLVSPSGEEFNMKSEIKSGLNWAFSE